MSGKTGKTIRVGIGGWTYEPWRCSFYPDTLPQKRELEYASSKLSSIEVNGTYYRTQKPETFEKWFAETPEDFVFSLKAPRYATNRKVLAQSGDSIKRFFDSGILNLKHKLGPINWQFMPTKTFEPDDFEAFLTLLPKSRGSHRLRHAVEVRHESFQTSEFIKLARKYKVAIVLAGDSEFPQIAAMTAPFVYLRVMGTRESEALGYDADGLDRWADAARSLSRGRIPEPLSSAPSRVKESETDVFLYVISGHKARNPQAAMALLDRLR